MPFLCVQIKGISVIVGAAVPAADKLRHKAALAHGTQLKYRLDHPQVGAVLADHIQAVQHQTQLPGCFLSGRRKRSSQLGEIHGKAYPFNGGGNAMKDVLHLGFPHGIHIASGHQRKLRIAEQPAGTEQLAFQPQTVCSHCRDHAQLRGENRQNAVCFSITGLLQYQTHGHKWFHLPFLLPDARRAAAPVVYNRDNGEYSPCRQRPASLQQHPSSALLPFPVQRLRLLVVSA